MDFAIVGGGLVGCGLAFQLARAGADVALFEETATASGASGGLGLRGVRANGRDIRELPLMVRAYQLWPGLAGEIGGATGFEAIGSLRLVEREEDQAEAVARAEVQKRMGIPSQIVSGAALRERQPGLADAIETAIFAPLDGVANHTMTTRNLCRAAMRLGAQINERRPIQRIEVQQQRVTALLTAQGERVPINLGLILCANTGVPHLLADNFDLWLPVWRRLPQVLTLLPREPFPLRHLLGHAHRRIAVKALSDGTVMVSGGWNGRWNPTLQAAETLPHHLAGNIAEAVATLPALADAQLLNTAVDRWESQSLDGIPIIDSVPGISNCLYATGWSGHGWALGPAISALLAEWILSDSCPPELVPFARSRFGLDKPT